MGKKLVSLYALLGRAKNTAPREPLPPVVKRMFALAFMTEFIVIYPFYVIMFGERGDVSAGGIGVLLAVWMVVSVLAEVPTGVIADKFSKKWSLVLGHVMQVLTFTAWLVFPNFTGYLIGFALWGVGEAFLSGAFQAYLYEALDSKNKKAFGKVYSRSSAFNMLAYMSGGLAAFAIGPDYPLLLILSVAVSAVSLGIALSLPRTPSTVAVEMRPKILSGALRAIRSSRVLRHILVFAVIVQCLMGVVGEYLPAYYHQVGTPTRFVALIISLGSASAFLLYWWMHRVEAKIARYQLLIILVCTGLFALSFMGGTIVAVVGFFLFTRMLRVMSVHNETQIQHHAPDESRATLGSLHSFTAKLLGAGVITLIGFFAVNDKIVAPLRWSIVIAVLMLTLSSAYFALRQKTPIFIKR